MKLGLLVVLAVAVLVPSLSEGRVVSRCELKKQLGEAIVLPKKLQKYKEKILAIVICEVERRSRLNTDLVRVFGKRKTTTAKPTTTILPTPAANETATNEMAANETTAKPMATKPTKPSVAGTTNGSLSGAGGSRRKREADKIPDESETTDDGSDITDEEDEAVAEEGAEIAEEGDTTSDEDEMVAEEGDEIAEEGDTTGDEDETVAEEGDEITEEDDATDDESDVTEMDQSLEETFNEEESKFDEEQMEEDDNKMADEDEESEEDDVENGDEQEVEGGGKRKKRFVPRWKPKRKPKRKWKPWSLGFYGLFQLSDSTFCNSGYRWSRNVCKTNCKAFTDDDIMDDIKCFVKSRYWLFLLRSARRCYRTKNFFDKCQ